jgi:hypothetical protein
VELGVLRQLRSSELGREEVNIPQKLHSEEQIISAFKQHEAEGAKPVRFVGSLPSGQRLSTCGSGNALSWEYRNRTNLASCGKEMED